MSRRSELLAERIEEGAARLAAFAETLSDAEWHLPVSATDGRSIGVIVHHVASVYPVEVEVARSVAGGTAVTEVTWEAVADMNASHAARQGKIRKAAALELWRNNGREAAVAVGTLTDAQL